MNTRLGRIVVLVEDYDAAFEFYSRNFNCRKLFDAVVSEDIRFLHIGFDSDAGCGIWFLKAETEEQKALLGNQTGGQPLLVLYTDDCKVFYDILVGNGVSILEPPASEEGSTYFHCADLYGNRITVVELHGLTGSKG